VPTEIAVYLQALVTTELKWPVLKDAESGLSPGKDLRCNSKKSMEWKRWTVKSRRKKESVDDDIRYTIKNREQNRHHLEYPMNATEVMITHYTMDSAKFILDKMAIPSSAYGYKKIILQSVDNTHSTITVMYNLVHSTTPVMHIAVTSRPPPTNRCNRSPRALSRGAADAKNHNHN
jgi:hypothetical protein